MQTFEELLKTEQSTEEDYSGTLALVNTYHLDHSSLDSGKIEELHELGKDFSGRVVLIEDDRYLNDENNSGLLQYREFDWVDDFYSLYTSKEGNRFEEGLSPEDAEKEIESDKMLFAGGPLSDYSEGLMTGIDSIVNSLNEKIDERNQIEGTDLDLQYFLRPDLSFDYKVDRKTDGLELDSEEFEALEFADPDVDERLSFLGLDDIKQM